MEELRALLAEAVARRVTPGACLAWARLGEPPQVLCVGHTARPGPGLAPQPVTPATVYDLASLTKPLVTTLGAMLLVADGVVALDEPLRRLLPGWAGVRRDEVRLAHLLAHEAGLPWWLPLHHELAGTPPAARAEALRSRLLTLEPEPAPGQATVYSDPGFWLLGWALEQAAGEPLAALVARRLWPAWGVTLGYVDRMAEPGWDDQPAGAPSPAAPRPAAWRREELLGRAAVAATERCPWRQRVLLAEVHDENAWFLGGVAPHAGLFGTALDVLRCGLGLLAVHAGQGGSAPLRADVVRTFWEGGSRPGGASWALGWDTPSPGRSSAGSRVSPGAVGHLGFTGTSLWIDPARRAAVALLTNRVHPSRADERIRALRPAVHDAVWAWLDR